MRMCRQGLPVLLFVGSLTGVLWAQSRAPVQDTPSVLKTAPTSSLAAATPTLAAPSPSLENYARLPLAFEKEAGGSGERFVARGPGYAIGLDRGKATLGIVAKDKTSHAVSLEFAGSRLGPAIPGPELPGKINYIRGNYPRKWQTGLASYGRVTYPNAYPGIDVVYYGNQQQLEFDFVVKPGANPSAIRLKVEGTDKLSIDGSGALVLGDAAGALGDAVGGLRVALPQIYQEVNGAKRSVPGHYAIVGRNEVAFRVDLWDHTRPLVIDPTIVYSALFGGGLSTTLGQAIGLDSSGNILIAGYTYAADFPTVNAAQNSFKGTSVYHAFVTKINSAGTGLIYSTYLGGSSYDYVYGIAVDSTGAAWVTGQTESSDFPVLNAAQPTYGHGKRGCICSQAGCCGRFAVLYLSGWKFLRLRLRNRRRQFEQWICDGLYGRAGSDHSGRNSASGQSFTQTVTKYGPTGRPFSLISTLLWRQSVGQAAVDSTLMCDT